MLPYFRSMEAFFNLSLPKDWQSLSDSQLQYFFTQLSHDLPMEEILTLCLFNWADLRVLCKTHDGSYLVKHRQAPKHETTLTIRQGQAATASLDFLRRFAPLPVRITKIGRATAIEVDFLGYAPPIGEVLRTAMNAQIRALTGGDITKEEAVLSMDTWRALTELDAKAKEVEDIKRQTK